MGKILIIIAPEGYQDIEYNDSKSEIEAKGHTVITASTEKTARGKYGETKIVDILLKDVFPKDYDAIVFIGGPGSEVFFHNPLAHDLAKDFIKLKKPVAAICAAPSILANAGLLKNKKVTCFPDQAENLKEKGALLTRKGVEKDGLIITANGPASAKKFGKTVVAAIR